MPHIVAQPYDYELPRKLSRIALVIIDMQKDFLEPGGFGEILGNDVSKLQKIVPTVQQLQQTFRNYGLSIVQTKEGHRPDLYDCPPSKKKRGQAQKKDSLTIGDKGPMGRILILGEPGNEIIAPLAPSGSELVISKPGKGAFYNTRLHKVLRTHKISHLIFTGVTTEVCVQSTMREANDRGYECLLVEDATESYFPEFKQATLEMVRAQGGIVGWTATAQQVLTGLESARSSGIISDG
ncbi:MAG: isochorismatase family cysteine hydrolase [Cyanobacteria bacterium P01_D01_bin.36]